jgi:galactonate dehydratase
MTQSTLLPRRSFLTSAGAAAAGLSILSSAMADDRNPASQVADRSSSIRITGLQTWWIGPIVYLKIETNHGVTGWGEIKGVDPRVSKVLVESLFELIDGENPTRIEYIWQKLFRAHRDIRGGPFMIHAIAGIDIALWDLAGKLWGVPVYRLMGGPCRDRIRVYPSHKARKLPPPDVFEHSGTPADVQQIVEQIKAARKEIGDDGALMFDAHSAIPPATLMQVASALEPYDLLYLEEPAVPGNIEVFRRLKQHVKIPLATGERDRTIWGVLPYLTEGCIDVLQPDCCHTGGITQMKKIATLAEAYYIPLAPHCTASFLGIAASLHVSASVPLFLIHEFYPDNSGFNPEGIGRMQWHIDDDGYIDLPSGPGLGVQINEQRLEEESKKPQIYRWPGKQLHDGSISDY